MACARCGNASLALHGYPVGNAKADVCDPCWETVTGRPFHDPAYAMAGRVPSTFTEQIAEMQRRKAVIAENQLRRWEQAEANR